MADKKTCPCPCHRMTGIFITLFGLNFLLKTLGVYGENISNIVWPAILILAGLKHTAKGMCPCCDNS